MENKLILIVEDNEDNYVLADKILKHTGFNTCIKSTGKEVLDWCQNNVPDLILMDISLPDIEGTEVTKTLRTMNAFHNIPIIALTAYAMESELKKAIDSGCNSYLTKPFMPMDLIKKVKEYL
jgi:CheY-like chemotaxis protein